jgi:hypothetical protein
MLNAKCAKGLFNRVKRHLVGNDTRSVGLLKIFDEKRRRRLPRIRTFIYFALQSTLLA